MANFNVKYILPGDNKDKIIEKINGNFYEVFFNGVGEDGPKGSVGATGIRGQVGREGDIGITGERAAKWFFGTSEPLASESQEEDVWVNIGPTGNQEVYFYLSGSWVDSGETIVPDNEFVILPGASGPAGSTENSAININGDPGDKTFVFSDALPATGSMNPNFSKVMVSTDASVTSDFPILAFAKTFLPQSTGNIFSMNWSSGGTGYDSTILFPGVARLQSGLSSVYSATGGISLSTLTSNIIGNSSSTATFTGATGVSGAFSFSTPGVINLSSSNFSLNSGEMSVTIPGAGGTGYIEANSSTQLVDVNTSFNGINLEATVSNSSNTNKLLRIDDSNGNQLLEGWRENKFLLGTAGATGLKVVKGITLTSYRDGTFLSDGVDKYLNSGSPTNDVSVIFPPLLAFPAPVADGRTNRFMLSLGNNFSWATGLLGTGESRTFDFFLDSSSYAFAGIRVSPEVFGSTQRVYIDDAGGSAISSCQHIRITFIKGEDKLHYQGFSNDNYKCGWITYTVSLEEEIGDPGGGAAASGGLVGP